MEALLKRKRALEGENSESENDMNNEALEEEKMMAKEFPHFKKAKYTNKQRCLVFASRGITSRHRHLITDVRKLLPHHKKEVKFDDKNRLSTINEITEVKGCNSCIFFESRKKKDLYMWFASTPNGPSAKFHVQNLHTMDELKLTGNSLMGSRPLLVFDSVFDSIPHLQLLKQLFIKTWNTPHGHPKSKPFVDHVLSFFYADNRVWFRNYQVADASTDAKELRKMAKAGEETTSLVEIGPRFVLNLVKIFGGSFGGPTLYINENYISPNEMRRDEKKEKGFRFAGRVAQIKKRQKHIAETIVPKDALSDVFVNETNEA